jgi:2-oxoglutarate ferredoxin oxidoreductase subunit delta
MVVEEGYNQKGYPTVRITEIEQCTGCALCAEMCPDVCIRVWR